MRKLLLSLMVLASLVSCGKDNAVDGGTVAAVDGSNPAVTNPVVIGNAVSQELLNKINSPSTGFGIGILNVNSQTCKDKWIFTVCSSSSSGSNTTTWNALAASKQVTYHYYNYYGFSRSVVHANTNDIIEAKKVELRGLLNRASLVSGYAPTYNITVSGVQYVIDTRMPIQANPIKTDTDFFQQYQAI